MRMMRVPVLVPAVIRSGIAAAGAAGAGGTGGVVAVAAVAAKAAVGLTLVQPAGAHLVRVPGVGVVHRLAVLVVPEKSVGRLRVRVGILAAHLGVERRRSVRLALKPVVVDAVRLLLLLLLLRRQVLVLVAGLAARALLAAPALAGIAMQRAQHRHALVRVLLESRGLRGRQRRHEIR